MYLASQAVQGWSLCQCRRSDSISATAQIRHIVSLVNTAAKSLQLCPTLCDPIDGSPLGSSVSGILQARILEWGAIAFSNAWKWKAKVKSLSRVRLVATPWTVAHQAPPSMGFSRQEYWSGVPLPSPMHESEKRKWSHSVMPTLSDPMDCNLPGSSVHGTFQASVLEWGAISSYN